MDEDHAISIAIIAIKKRQDFTAGEIRISPAMKSRFF